MTLQPLILGFDTSAAHCAAALLSGDTLLAARAEAMSRGQAERLMPLIQELLAEFDVDWPDLAAIGVGIGPGNFTGIRISVSLARGLALALNIPAIGVSTFDATRLHTSADAAPDAIATVPAPRDQLYAQCGDEPGKVMLRADLEALAQPLLTPPAAPDLAQAIATLAGHRYLHPAPRPAPLYIKAADAAPPRDPAPVILSDDAG